MSSGHFVKRRGWELLDRGSGTVRGKVGSLCSPDELMGIEIAASCSVVRTLSARGRRKWSIACISELTVLAFPVRWYGEMPRQDAQVIDQAGRVLSTSFGELTRRGAPRSHIGWPLPWCATW
jgi:hypothetical protein